MTCTYVPHQFRQGRREARHRPITGLVAVDDDGPVSAVDTASRARRGDTLALARTAEPVPISESIMGAWARLVVDCRAAGIQRTVKLVDALIAATAIDLGLPVVAQDDDYDQMARAHRALHVLKV
ncbi:MAG TPA: PIN domain-containing protein [Acidimicrobiales bacterium]